MSAAAPVPLAITMGDPAGIGPEVVLRALSRRALRSRLDPILVGDPMVWRETALRLGLRLRFRSFGDRPAAHSLALVPTSELPARFRTPGSPRSAGARRACGAASYDAVLVAVRLVQEGRAAGLVTAPIAKAHVVAAGHDIPGHTELLARLCGGVPVRMMMAGPRLRVVLVTTHLPLAEVPRRLTSQQILETLALAAKGLRAWFGLTRPRLAVAGLNPHAGENGLFGNEEARVISPAVRAARRRGIDARGPFAADSLFANVAAGAYDAVVCMYHDQGLAPFKLLHFADGVNLTLGLPFLRTSPDHGTAFDIAGRGQADPSSMIAALRLAADGAQGRRRLRNSG